MRLRIPFSLLLYTLVFTACKQEKKEAEIIPEQSQIETISKSPQKVLSPHISTIVIIGDTQIQINYSSPGVRNRMIFGGLLAYDQVWQAGAHMATWIETNNDLIIDDKVLPAGKYGFFTIPSKNEWTVIFNSNWNQHGKDEYNEKDDVLRFKAIPKTSGEIIEHLEYKIIKANEKEGAISLAWERVFVSFNFQLKQ
ncbi:hypothetical protein KCTC52924_03559 [Arenibacter antarcticus]|uniref:DUF2911 domain-containing protein n=1 Tax=Arenibacter antarcticus TaxID=2040469 RepID=A0ABW5VIF6_9FLAO|nr:DUF2911 domain-containing protein [Arenibacter sp. H213]MCM4166619.1 hypothetical protein [Arenibacter sp. H213]